ncbi:MAG: hypothetical protein LBG26_00370 [Treponema sp.]|nr:hypothetical protein [Treponema sp.]
MKQTQKKYARPFRICQEEKNGWHSNFTFIQLTVKPWKTSMEAAFFYWTGGDLTHEFADTIRILIIFGRKDEFYNALRIFSGYLNSKSQDDFSLFVIFPARGG